MKLGLMEKLPILPHMPYQTKLVRRRAPRYIRSVIEDSKALSHIDSIEELHPEYFDALSGGNLSATYLVKAPQQQVVIKLSTDSIAAEAEALIEWRKRRVHVPRVLAYGVVPVSRHEKVKVKYLIMEAILERYGRIAESCKDYLIYHPEKSRAIGRALGAELTKMHSGIAKRSFGEYADTGGTVAPYHTWGSYVVGYINEHYANLCTLVPQGDVDAVKRYIAKYPFSTSPRYIHGDYSVRNSLITAYEPLKIVVFDPNPIIGDPSWDVAVVLNNYAYQKFRRRYSGHQPEIFRRDQQIWIGFKQGYKREIDEGALPVSQLIHAIFQIGFYNGKKRWENDKNGLKAYEDFIRDRIKEIVKREKAL